MSKPYIRHEVDGSFERRFLIGLIVSDQFCKEARAIYAPEYVGSEPVRIIADWCFKYYDQYEAAPRKHIQDIYGSNIAGLDAPVVDFVEGLLVQVSDEWEHAAKFNVDFLLDETEKQFKTKSLLALAANIRDFVAIGGIRDAEAALLGYTAVTRPRGGGINPFTDAGAIERAFNATSNMPLFRLPGVLGEIMNNQFYRKAFVAFQGPEKRGKSYWIDEICIRAYRSRCNVALFDLGDMDEDERVARIHCHLAMKPLAKFCKSGAPIDIPILDCMRNQLNSCTNAKRPGKVGIFDANGEPISFEIAERMGYQPCINCEDRKPTVYKERRQVSPLLEEEAVENGKAFFQRTGGKHFKLSCHINNTLNIRGIDTILEIWKNTEGFVPDVIGIDYPGIAAPEDTRKDHRNQVNDTWKAMRALAQKWHACVVTADQTDTDSYDKENITLKNFSEDKRKYGHVTAFYALNQTDEERNKGIMRIGELVIRHGETNRIRKIYVLECRALGRINIGSFV